MGRGAAGKDCHRAYQYISTSQHLHQTVKILKQTRSSKAAKEEVERVHLFEANTSYLCFIKGFLVSWHCVIHLQPHSLPPPV